MIMVSDHSVAIQIMFLTLKAKLIAPDVLNSIRISVVVLTHSSADLVAQKARYSTHKNFASA